MCDRGERRAVQGIVGQKIARRGDAALIYRSTAAGSVGRKSGCVRSAGSVRVVLALEEKLPGVQPIQLVHPRNGLAGVVLVFAHTASLPTAIGIWAGGRLDIAAAQRG